MKAPEQSAWQRFGNALPGSTDNCGIHKAVYAAIINGPARQRWLIACSGGADSVACAGWMAHLAKPLGHSVALAHYNHRWRGEAADADAAFVRELAARLGVDCFSGEADVVPQAQTETTARAQRLAFLREQATQFDATAIVFGHHGDDVTESLLLRIGRGAGTDGLAAPRPIHTFDNHPPHWRPFLHLPAQTLRDCLKSAGIQWREDASNTDCKHPRNALRLQVLPHLEQLETRSYRTGAARTRMLMEEDGDALDDLAREHLPFLYREPAVMKWQLPPEIARALLRRGWIAWLTRLQPTNWPAAAQMDAALDLLQSRPATAMLLQTDTFVIRLCDGWVECVTNEEQEDAEPATPCVCEMALAEPIQWDGTATLLAEQVDLSDTLRSTIMAGQMDPKQEAWLDWDKLRQSGANAPSLRVRTLKAGDRFHSLGAPGSRKLSRILMDAGIPSVERKGLPLVVNHTDSVLWVPGLPPADAFRITPSSKQALRLTYRRSPSI